MRHDVIASNEQHAIVHEFDVAVSYLLIIEISDSVIELKLWNPIFEIEIYLPKL